MVGTAASYAQPAPSDEAAHPPGPELWWNESWYCDAVSHDGSLAMYTRLGRVPNQGQALVTASIVEPGGRANILVRSVALPELGEDRQRVDVPGLRSELWCEAPLRRFRVSLTGRGQAYADHSAPLRDEPGTEVEIACDLVWETDGLPYAWPRSTRYEIPCRAAGTVRIGDRKFELSGPGQRDHSWGVRDWFAADWMWCALHLEDGTHLHAVALPKRPGYGVGYVQGDGQLEEIAGVEASEEVADNGLISTAAIRIAPSGLALEIEPLAFGPVLLRAPDGRTSQFPRAMCRVRTADGRAGWGWIEWNRNQHR